MENDSAVLATYYAAFLNAIAQAGGDISDEQIEAINEDLMDGDWAVELTSGVWQARPVDDESEEDDGAY